MTTGDYIKRRIKERCYRFLCNSKIDVIGALCETERILQEYMDDERIERWDNVVIKRNETTMVIDYFVRYIGESLKDVYEICVLYKEMFNGTEFEL